MIAARPFALLLLAAVASPASAQLQTSDSYKFLNAVRNAKGEEVQSLIGEAGSIVINTRDINNGEGALHIVVKRGDNVYLRFLLQKGADPNLKDNKGNTPLVLAANSGQIELAESLISAKANVNTANNSGETPLIVAVHRRDIGMVRSLLAAKADPDQSDRLAGMSARDYAHEDTRSPAIAKLIDDTPKTARRAVSGPKL